MRLHGRMTSLLLGIVTSFACYAEGSQTTLTIYSTATPGAISPDLYRPTPNAPVPGNSIPGYAIVRVQKNINLGQAENKIFFTEVAALIDPTTVVFKSLTDPQNTMVTEQDYNFDLVSNQKLLERYLGQEITVEQNHADQIESFKGKLLSTSAGLILQDKDNKLISINDYSNIRFPDLPGGLTIKPTLVWNIATKKPGEHKIEASYQTAGMTWWADYNAIFEESKDANTGLLDISAWVSILNRSGADYDHAKLKLLAGDVNRAAVAMPRMMAYATYKTAENATPAFTEKPFFEFHLYTLNNQTTIPDNSSKQLELFPSVKKVPVEKQYVYNGATELYYGQVNLNKEVGELGNTKVGVYLKFKNDKKDGLGIPLPSGRVRVNKMDTVDGAIEFIGEDTIDHTAKDEEVLIKMGNAFDITANRKQISFNVDNNRRVMEEVIEITLKNHKEQDVKVLVKENMYRSINWQLMETSVQYEKMDAQTVHFPVAVKKNSETKVKYMIRYTW